MNTTVESKTTNFWELRKATNEALQKAKSAFNTLSTERESKPEPKQESKPKQESWTKVKTKKTKQTNNSIDAVQDELINELKTLFVPKKNFIDTGLAHQVNFSYVTVVNVSGLVTFNVGGHPADFNKERFFENKKFQNRVRDAFSTVFPNGWLVFFKGREAGTYCIKIVPRV